MNELRAVSVGPSGWSHDDWDEVVHPPNLGSRRLDAIAALFPLIEVHSTFERTPTPAAGAAWARKAAEHPGLRFTAVLARLFTHEDPRHWTLRGRDQFRDGLEPIRESGGLGALLARFPAQFEATDDAVQRLSRIRNAFPEHNLVLEVGHPSWREEQHLEQVSSLGYSWCVVDGPGKAESVAPAIVTGPSGYLRLCGRNEAWRRPDATEKDRADYLYSEDELIELVDLAERLQQTTEVLYVVTANHTRGQAAVNGLEIQFALNGQVPEIPTSLQERYPRLAALRE